MAKLSANGRERYRLIRTRLTPTHDLYTEERITISVRSTGAILMKREIKFKPGKLDPDGRWHNFGWKTQLGVAGARKQGLTAEKIRDAYLKNGYELPAASS